MKRIKNIPNKLKFLTHAKDIGLSYSALWYGLLTAGLLWIGLVGAGTLLVLATGQGSIYSMADLLQLVTWLSFFLGGFIAAYKAGFKGWQHGLWVGIFLGLLSVIFLLEIVPSIIAWQQVLFQWVAAAILGTAGGIVGYRALKTRKDRRGYSFKEAKKERSFELDRSK